MLLVTHETGTWTLRPVSKFSLPLRACYDESPTGRVMNYIRQHGRHELNVHIPNRHIFRTCLLILKMIGFGSSLSIAY